MFVYVMTNKLMPGFCKIGISGDVDRRCEGMYGPWRVIKSWETDSAAAIERIVKRELRCLRAHGHELFNCPTDFLVSFVERLLVKDVEPTLPGKRPISPFALLITEPVPVAEVKGFVVQNSAQVGEIIRAVRKKQEMSQAATAGALGLGPRFIVDLEKGKPTCEIQKTLEVLYGLGVKITLQPPEV